MIFVDTGAWYAAFVSEDSDHERAYSVVFAPGDRLVTTDYVVDELLTLLKARGYFDVAIDVGDDLLNGETCQLEWVQPADVREAWSIYCRFRDQEWSFTDCVSRVVMERLGVRTAISLDHHFRQFGTVAVLP